MKKLWNHYSYAIILIVISILSAFILSVRFDALNQTNYKKVTISEGDTLWKIAGEYSANQNLSNKEFVDWVQSHNNINEDQIFPGEKIIIPISSDEQPVSELAGATKD